MNILIVEDEAHIAEGLRFNLDAEGYAVTLAETGEAGLEQLSASRFDAIVLDVMLPGIDGFEVARTLREAEDFTPILMLTARGRSEDVLKGFEAGADDYLPKPFDLAIFLARLNSLIRRAGWKGTAKEAQDAVVLEINGRTVDLGNLELTDAEGKHRLTLMEAKLLGYLIEAEGRTVGRRELLENVWQLAEDTDTRAIDNFIVRLRKYLEDDPADPQILKTVRGIGYRFIAS